VVGGSRVEGLTVCMFRVLGFGFRVLAQGVAYSRTVSRF
jgi:hypothetical protein